MAPRQGAAQAPGQPSSHRCALRDTSGQELSPVATKAQQMFQHGSRNKLLFQHGYYGGGLSKVFGNKGF
jgi:hypothetical protein